MLVDRGAVVGKAEKNQVDFPLFRRLQLRDLVQNLSCEHTLSVMVKAHKIGHRKDASEGVEPKVFGEKVGVFFDVSSLRSGPAANENGRVRNRFLLSLRVPNEVGR